MKIIHAGASPGTIYNSYDHIHNHWEIVMNISGTGVTFIGDESFEFGSGFVCIIPPGVAHKKNSENGFCDVFMSVDALNFDTRNEIVTAWDDEEKTLETLMYMIVRVFHKNENNKAAILDTLAQTVCNFIVGKMKTDKNTNPDIERFINELIVNYRNCDFSVSDAMKNTNYNKDHFRRIFKEYTGVTPVEYLTGLRVSCAKNMLKNNYSRKIKEIAFESGFSEYLYFTKLFKRHTGMTPGEYSAQNRPDGAEV